jgi:hypothetical protein
MKVGAIFPQTECGTDVAGIGEFVRTVEAMGFDHLFVADHVLGADPRFHSHPSLATLGATSVIAEPRGAGLKFPDGHLDVLRRFKETVKEAS